MNRILAQKQNYLYFSMILVTMGMTFLSYRTFQKKWLLFREAENKFQEQEFKKAIDLYQKSLSLGTTSPQVLAHLADAYAAVRNPSEAIRYYRAYLDLYPNDFAIRHSFAQVLRWNGNIQEAEREYQILLQQEHATKTNS